MQRRLTWFLTGTALCLFAFIYFFERKMPSSAERHEAKRVLPMASVNEIDAIQVTLPNGGVVRAEKTNGNWTLTQPHYPAHQVAVETFATNLVELRAFDRIPAGEAKSQGGKSFGFAPPRATVDLRGPSNSFRFEIGGIAPLTSNLYLRLPGSGDIILANASLLDALPQSTNDWRIPALFQLSGLDFDHIQVRVGQRSFELGRGTNNAWQISKPVPARADQERVLQLLQILRTAEASEFVTDSPGADLEQFGLQAPEVEVSFSAGTNRVYGIAFGNSPTNQTDQVFAELLGQTNVVLAPRQLVDYLRQPYKAFHDPRLVTITAGALDRVIVHAREDFTVQKQPRGGWAITNNGTSFPVDRELLGKFAGAVNSLRILDIVKEVPSEADLRTLGFMPAAASYAFFEKLTNTTGIITNILFSDINFGSPQVDTIYVRRSDESPVYLTQLATALELPKRAFELRDRQIWRFATNDVTGITLSNNAETNRVTRSATGWSTDAILNAQIEEVVFRLSRLEAQDWVEQGSARLATFGINEKSPNLAVDVRAPSGPERHTVHFGRQTLRRDSYAAVVFPGETDPLIFEFPGDFYQLLLQALPVPK